MPEGTYFFTVVTFQRQTFLCDEPVRTGKTHPFRIDGWVLLPDHLHAVWTLPEGDADFSTRWALIKAGFFRCTPADERRSKSRITKGERGIWQRRF